MRKGIQVAKSRGAYGAADTGASTLHLLGALHHLYYSHLSQTQLLRTDMLS